MKKLFFLIALFLFIFSFKAIALDIRVESGSDEDIQAAADQIGDEGGTIFIPAGEFQYDSVVHMPGGINLIGEGADKTIINITSSYGIKINSSGDQGGALRISGIRFNTDSNALRLYNIEDFRIHDCEFHAVSDTSSPYMVSITHKHGYPKPRGVIDHCSFYFYGKGYGVHVKPQPWPEEESRIAHLGTAQNVFIEDCYFENPYHAASSFNGSHYVFRYNTLVDSVSGVDAHGPGYEYIITEPEPQQYRGGRSVEIYENKFINASWAPIKLRSGGGVIFNNDMINAKHAIILKLEDESYEATGGEYPGLDQIHDMWIWGNYFEDISMEEIYIYGDHAEDFIKEDRDYFLREPSQGEDGFTYTPYTYPHPLVGEKYYVAKNDTSCSDSGEGTEEEPWCTIQKAASTLVAGETVYIKEGEYAEKVTVANSGSPKNYITFKAYPEDKPHITGNGSCIWDGVFNIESKSYIKLEEIELSRENCYDSNQEGWIIYVASGLYIELTDLDVHHAGGESEHIQVLGESKYIKILNNEVHDGKCVSGIDVYTKGTGSGSQSGRPEYITIANNNVYNINPWDDGCGIGAGIATERVDYASVYNNVVNTSRMGLDIGCGKENKIYNNTITDSSTGIAISGNEGSLIYNNVISGADEEAFLSYDHEDHSAEIHERNKWYKNKVFDSYVPFMEYRKKSYWVDASSRDHEIYNNLFYNNTGKIILDHTEGIKFYNNTVYGNHGVSIQEYSLDAIIKNNIFSINGSGRYAIQVDDTTHSTATLDYNNYQNRAGVFNIINWNGAYYNEDEIEDGTFFSDTGQGQHSFADDPLFVDVENNDFHLKVGSPCIDTGLEMTYEDLDGNPRPFYAGFDIGAYEFKCEDDDDGDGYADPGSSTCIHSSEDCDDGDPEINPGASEVCDDELDNDCDGKVDEEDPDCIFCWDNDEDGYEDEACGGDDCNDSDPEVNPGASEVCDDSLDNDCDGLIDFDDEEDCFVEMECRDGDEQSCDTGLPGICAMGIQICIDEIWGECEQEIFASEEVCDDELDNDCDGLVDLDDEEDCFVTMECRDGDEQSCDTGLLGICAIGVQTCLDGFWGICEQEIFSSDEICDDEIDNDCDTYIDDLDAECNNEQEDVDSNETGTEISGAKIITGGCGMIEKKNREGMFGLVLLLFVACLIFVRRKV